MERDRKGVAIVPIPKLYNALGEIVNRINVFGGHRGRKIETSSYPIRYIHSNVLWIVKELSLFLYSFIRTSENISGDSRASFIAPFFLSDTYKAAE